MRTLSARERKLVAVFILLACLGLFWMVVVAPLLAGVTERAERRLLLERQYQANQRIIGSIPRLRRLAERQRGMLQNLVISAASPTAASAMVEERLQRTIEATGGELGTIEAAAGGDRLVRMRTTARMTLPQLATLLARLQNEPPYMTVEALNVTSDQALLSGRADMMEISFEVSLPVILAQPR